MQYIHKIINYSRVHGKKALIKKIIAVLTSKNGALVAGSNSSINNTQNLSHLYNLRFDQLAPLKVFHSKQNIEKRINLVTDSINRDSLFGGVITAIVFTFLLAQKNNARVRIITRTHLAEEFRIKEILDHYGIEFVNEISFVFADFLDTKIEIDVFSDDYFITTSWWTTYSTTQSIKNDKILYLLQEDERMFYPYGDEHLLCSETLANTKIKFIVNSKLLYNHLVNTGLKNITDNGQYFEPSFDIKNYYWEKNKFTNKKKFFFYARPNNLRNLFYRGIHIIELAIKRGIIDLNIWDIYFVGKDLPHNLELNSSYKIHVITDLTYSQY
ncbi:MAG: hypothetical protein K0R94_595, partial [Burkholderiales bacterium]|nr:hypothetical protein [Burkholderiales bacterium]